MTGNGSPKQNSNGMERHVYDTAQPRAIKPRRRHFRHDPARPVGRKRRRAFRRRAAHRSRRCSGRPTDLGAARLGAADLVRPGRHTGDHQPVHDPLCAARRDGQTDAGQSAGAVAGGIMVHLGGQPDLRIRRAARRQIPQRRSGHGRGRQVFVRTLSRHVALADERAGRRDRGAGRASRPLQAEEALARFSYLLFERQRRRLDRAEEICREGRRRRFQAAPDRRRPIQICLVQLRRRACPRSVRRLLAQRRLRSSES